MFVWRRSWARVRSRIPEDRRPKPVSARPTDGTVTGVLPEHIGNAKARLWPMTAPDAERFDALAPIYDQVVPFFGLLGERLVHWAAPTPGQRVLDLGAGRGAVSSALSGWMGPAAD